MRVKITLAKEARLEAIEMRKLRGIATGVDFEGPNFTNVRDTEIVDGFVFVRLEDESIYGYPVNTIARVAQYED